jgi:hypothetical protein
MVDNMLIEKIWQIKKMEVTTTSNDSRVVTHVHWECTGTDGTHTGRVFKMIELDPPNFENFTDYSSLTESQVISWVHEKMTPEIVSYWEQLVDIQIEKQHRPKQDELELPWK